MGTTRHISSIASSNAQDHGHSVQFYRDDQFLIDDLQQFIGTALAEGSSAVVIATKAHNETLGRELRSHGIDLSSALDEGRYQSFEASELLSQFFVDGGIDRSRFSEIVGNVIARASAASRNENRRVVAFGEMVALLWAEGKAEAAIQLEKLWNGLARTHSFALRCGYPMQGFSREEHSDLLSQICAEHSVVIPEESHIGLASEDLRLRDIVRLQHQAQVLRSEIEWRRAEERFKLFVDAVQDYAIFVLDPQGRVTSWNPGAERIKGYRESEILGKHFSLFYPKEDIEAKKPQKLLDIAVRDGRVEDEGWRLRKNGEPFWARVTITAVRNETGTLVGFGKVTRDLTEQKHSEAVIRRQEERFQLFIHNVQDYALFLLDADGYVTTWNLGAERINGYKASEIIGQHFSCFYPVGLRAERPRHELEVAAKAGRFEDEGWRLRKDGTKFWANVVITAIRDNDGQLIGFGKVTRDLTDRMLAQEKVNESERSLRELSLHLLRSQEEERRRIGREIHDSLGQYLSVLQMKLESMNSPGSNPDDAAECVKLVEECVREVRTISYLLYPPMLEEMGLKSAIPWYLDGFSKRSGIKTTFEAPARLGRLTRDAELVLFRVLQESLTNVQRHSGSQTADIRIVQEDSSVVLEVTDHGRGLPAAVVEQGTNEWTGSLGVGLRGMSERLRQLGGSLDISSDQKGTRVRAMVPVEIAPAKTATNYAEAI